MDNGDRKILDRMIFLCGRIEESVRLCEQDFSVFRSKPLVVESCAMCVVWLGNLGSRLSDALKMKYDSIGWTGLPNLAERFVGRPDDAMNELCWVIYRTYIPALRSMLEKIC